MTVSTQDLLQRAQHVIPGGVNSPVRAFKSVGGDPLFIKRAQGPYLIDTADQQYIDYVGSWGPMVLGHAHPAVIAAVHEAVDLGLSYGAPCEAEVILAELVCELVPSIEMLRCVSSGTEATMTAIRLARGITGRDKIIKFAGCYHGHSDSLLVEAGSGLLTLSIPSSTGVPKEFTTHTLVADFNDISSVQQLFDQFANEIAAVIVEPVAGNMNCIPAQMDFLQGLREVCDTNNALLIFDEVMSGFRVALGGAQAHYNIMPDLTALGKVIGGGMPVGAVGGARELMEHLAPVGDVYQAGTLSGNPVAMAAGIATLQQIQREDFFVQLSKRTQQLVNGLKDRAHAADIPFSTHSLGGMFGFFFTDVSQVTYFSQVKKGNMDQFKHFFHGMLAKHIYFAPSAFEAGFVSSTHQDEHIQATLDAAEGVFAQLPRS